MTINIVKIGMPSRLLLKQGDKWMLRYTKCFLCLTKEILICKLALYKFFVKILSIIFEKYSLFNIALFKFFVKIWSFSCWALMHVPTALSKILFHHIPWMQSHRMLIVKTIQMSISIFLKNVRIDIITFCLTNL